MTAHPTRIFVLTGAGISAQSGLGTFRDVGGIWAKFDPSRLATRKPSPAISDTVQAF